MVAIVDTCTLLYIDKCRHINVDICRIPCESLLIIKKEHLKEDISDIMASFLEYDTAKSPLVCTVCLCLNHKQSDDIFLLTVTTDRN